MMCSTGVAQIMALTCKPPDKNSEKPKTRAFTLTASCSARSKLRFTMKISKSEFSKLFATNAPISPAPRMATQDFEGSFSSSGLARLNKLVLAGASGTSRRTRLATRSAVLKAKLVIEPTRPAFRAVSKATRTWFMI